MPPIPEVIPALEQVPGIRAFFTTRRGGVSEGAFRSLNLGYFSGDDIAKVRENWDRLLRSQGLEPETLALPGLCHGTRLEEITGSDSHPENCDAVYTCDQNRVLAVTLGDCLAALIVDPDRRCVAAVHAGWRGSRDNILGKTLAHLFVHGHCSPESTWVALSPCLSPGALEISEEIAGTLPAAHVQLRENLFYFDLRGCNRSQAEEAGVFPEHIVEAAGCTRTDSEHFFSYRRDGAASGRMAACIALI